MGDNRQPEHLRTPADPGQQDVHRRAAYLRDVDANGLDETIDEPTDEVTVEPALRAGASWLGTAAASEYLGITSRTLYRFVNDGLVPAYKMGRVIRFRIHELDAFIESTRIQPGDLDNLAPKLVVDDAS
jgi:excisionase family DNA binding protein